MKRKKNLSFNEVGYKKKVQKMRNDALLSEWENIRCRNVICNDKCNNCSSCINRGYCTQNLLYEEMITNELIQRGLFYKAMNLFQLNEKKEHFFVIFMDKSESSELN